jgi:hypothetical protein
MVLGVFGSNQVAAIGSMSAAEAVRSDLISRIDLRVVGDKRL